MEKREQQQEARAVTKEEKAYVMSFGSIGCIVSNIYFNAPGTPYDVHHLVGGGRKGWLFTIPLSPWFHRGVPNIGVSQKRMAELYGPSLAKSKAAFEDRFGSEEFLLDETKRLLSK